MKINLIRFLNTLHRRYYLFNRYYFIGWTTSKMVSGDRVIRGEPCLFAKSYHDLILATDDGLIMGWPGADAARTRTHAPGVEQHRLFCWFAKPAVIAVTRPHSPVFCDAAANKQAGGSSARG
ncbi:TPA: hypothetical protein I8Y12_002205 [Raoultella planticola]|nr:hypothetical protein [Raoultella planticola]HAT1646312.1 hypothetical protein [Raoultella planticola]